MINNTTELLKEVSKTLIHGEAHNGYYDWASFVLNNARYIISMDDAYIVNLGPIEQEPHKCNPKAVPHKGNKGGGRAKYSFMLNGKQVNVDCARLNAALLIPGCLDKIVSGEKIEINHKATLFNSANSVVFDVCYKAYSFYKENKWNYSEEKLRLLVHDNFSDVYALTKLLSDDFTRCPVYPRDNRVTNLEVCSHADNQTHFNVVREFEAIQNTNCTPLITNITQLQIEASVAVKYMKGNISREDFVKYANTKCKRLDLVDVLASNFQCKISNKTNKLIENWVLTGSFDSEQ